MSSDDVSFFGVLVKSLHPCLTHPKWLQGLQIYMLYIFNGEQLYIFSRIHLFFREVVQLRKKSYNFRDIVYLRRKFYRFHGKFDVFALGRTFSWISCMYVVDITNITPISIFVRDGAP